MQIQPADSSHTDYISSSLVDEYSETNRTFGYPRYKEDYDLMYKHVSSRIKEGGDFVYFVAVENETPVGFINLLTEESNLGSILIIRGDTKEIKEELIHTAVEYFKEKGISTVVTETMLYDNDVLDILKSLGVKDHMIIGTLNL